MRHYVKADGGLRSANDQSAPSTVKGEDVV